MDSDPWRGLPPSPGDACPASPQQEHSPHPSLEKEKNQLGSEEGGGAA